MGETRIRLTIRDLFNDQCFAGKKKKVAESVRAHLVTCSVRDVPAPVLIVSCGLTAAHLRKEMPRKLIQLKKGNFAKGLDLFPTNTHLHFQGQFGEAELER